jgi:tetratricopeptide (TPR) repeat protein
MMIRTLLTGLALMAAMPRLACGQGALDSARALYAENKLAEAYPLFADAVREDPGNAEAHAWLAETARRRGMYDEALSAARAALAIDSCNAFALTVLGYLYQPIYSGWRGTSADSSWHNYRQAVACDPADGNAWVGLWMEALRRGDTDRETRALQRLVTTGFLTRSVLAYNRWVLRALPENAILLTNGDWDTYPALGLQLVDHLRPDVGIVNLSMLNLPWYVRLVSERYGIPEPLGDRALDSLQSSGRLADAVVQAWRAKRLAGTFGRPLALAGTSRAFASSKELGTFQDAGPYRLLTSDGAAADTAAMRRALADVSASDFAGPEVSPADRSAVRMAGTAHRGLATGVLSVALRYTEAMRDAGREADATRMLAWADDFVKAAGLGPDQRQMIQRVREGGAP